MTVVKTRLGQVQGLHDDGVDVFLGLPYAAAPVGSRRWLAPAPAPAWTGTFDATHFPNCCPQPPTEQEVMIGREPGAESEDCLYLNIYTPGTDGKPRPVMFWIHGGGFIQGSGNLYDGSALARNNDIVVVSINYRLSIFGFLDVSRWGPEYAGSGSRGFEDQIAALAWVADNIADYGGDAGNVTICGQSAGAASVLALLGAPGARGLFHKAVAFSGILTTDPVADAVGPLAAHLQIEEGEVEEHLKALSTEALAALSLVTAGIWGSGVDGKVITESTMDAIRSRGADGVPLITGCCEEEGNSLVGEDTRVEALEMAMEMFTGAITGGAPADYNQYLDQLLPEGSARDRFKRIWYDYFRSPSLQTALASNEAGSGGWVYDFNVPTDDPMGIAHGCEVAFTFNWFKDEDDPIAFHDGRDPAIRELAELWSRTFVAFARTGNPNGAGLPEWPQYDAQRRACLVFDSTPHIENDPDGKELRNAYGVA